jgi:integration host factor subunit beta
MTKSELIAQLAGHYIDMSFKEVEQAVKSILEQLSQTMVSGHRIEIRGFGSFTLHHRASRTGRNPKTGEAVELESKYAPHFKPGKEMRDRVNQSLLDGKPILQSKDEGDEE